MKEKIVPSAPFKNYADIESLAARVSGEVRRIQVDVCDGKYVKNVSWPFTEYAKTDFAKLFEKPDLDVFLPAWEKINYSVDLMVENPMQYIESFVAYGVDEVIVHFRSLQDKETEFQKILNMSKTFSLSLVLAIDVKTDLEEFVKFARKYIVDLNGFQVMGIENIGLQGQDFSEMSLDIVRKLKQSFPDTRVLFDGAINDETIEEIKNAGVDVFCVGSFLTNSLDFEGNLGYLKNVIR